MPTAYESARSGAVLFDRSDAGKLVVTGPEAPAFLQNLSTNDIKSVPLGGGAEAYFCNPQAKCIGHAFIYHVRLADHRNAFRLDTEPGQGETLYKHLERHWIAEQIELIDESKQFSQFHLAGPSATAMLSEALGEPMPALGDLQHMERTIGRDATVQIRRRDPLGIPGFDIVCRVEQSAGIRALLPVVTGDVDTYNVLRAEAGTAIYGIDVDATRFVMETPNPLRAVSYAKGCYLGQEPIVMSRDRAGFVPRTFLGVRVLDGTAPRGTKLLRDGMEVGLITTSVISPTLGNELALGYIKRGHQEPGLRLQTNTGGNVEVLAFPPVR